MMARFMLFLFVLASIIFISHVGSVQKLPLPAHALQMADEGEVDKNAQEQMEDEEDGNVSELTAEGADVKEFESEDNVDEEDTGLAMKPEEDPQRQPRRRCRRRCSTITIYVRIRVRVRINFRWRWVTRRVPRRRRKCQTVCRG